MTLKGAIIIIKGNTPKENRHTEAVRSQATNYSAGRLSRETRNRKRTANAEKTERQVGQALLRRMNRCKELTSILEETQFLKRCSPIIKLNDVPKWGNESNRRNRARTSVAAHSGEILKALREKWRKL